MYGNRTETTPTAKNTGTEASTLLQLESGQPRESKGTIQCNLEQDFGQILLREWRRDRER
jgi:hypothetical protein